MTKQELTGLIEALADVVREYVDSRVGSTTIDEKAAAVVESVRGYIGRELAPLKARIAELEARPMMRYRGTFDGGVGDYAAGDVCTSKGVLWFCMKPTRERPGESTDWKMMHRLER